MVDDSVDHSFDAYEIYFRIEFNISIWYYREESFNDKKQIDLHLSKIFVDGYLGYKPNLETMESSSSNSRKLEFYTSLERTSNSMYRP